MTVIGTLISERYRLEEKIGSGGMSSVYRAFDPMLERWVAIKLMHRDISNDPGPARALPPRGPGRRAAQPPARGDRDRRRRGRRESVHRLRVRGGRDAEGAHPPSRAPAGGRGGGVRDRDRPRARVRPREQARPSRREAAERPDRPRRPRQGHRLRHRPLARGPGPDRHRPRARHDRLRVARAGARPRGHRPVRHLLARDRALRDAHRRDALPGGHAGGGGDEARARTAPGCPAPPAGDLLGARRRGGALDREGDAEPLPDGEPDGARPRGGAGDRGGAQRPDHRRGHHRAAVAVRRHRGLRADPAAPAEAGARADAPRAGAAGGQRRSSSRSEPRRAPAAPS